FYNKNLRKRFISFLVFTSVFLLVVTPWMIRNQVVIGEFMLSADHGKIRYWVYPNLMNLLEPLDRMRLWTAEEKQMMVEDAEKPGMNIAKVVKKYGVPPDRLIVWQDQMHNGKKFTSDAVKDLFHGYYDTEIQDKAIPVKDQIIRAVLTDARQFLGGTVHYLASLNSSGYPDILGRPVHKLNQGILRKGQLEMFKTAIQNKTMTEWFLMCLFITILSYLYLTMCFGIYSAVRKEEFQKIVLFISVILFFVMASSGPVIAESAKPRYRVTIMPFVVMLSSYGTMELIKRFKGPAIER
ncbi:MAG: transposase, partial [Nitrospirae bacterium]|nr:transposase [Nitrospirota bacterium]